MEIRSVNQTDFEKWKPLWKDFNDFYERVLAPEITNMTWARFLDAYEPVHAIVAEQNGRLLGFAHYLFYRSTATIETNCYLQDLFTVESARGQDVGRALIEAVYEQAKAAGSSRVYWLTHETNAAAINLYDKVAERSGFIDYRKQL